MTKCNCICHIWITWPRQWLLLRWCSNEWFQPIRISDTYLYGAKCNGNVISVSGSQYSTPLHLPHYISNVITFATILVGSPPGPFARAYMGVWLACSRRTYLWYLAFGLWYIGWSGQFGELKDRLTNWWHIGAMCVATDATNSTSTDLRPETSSGVDSASSTDYVNEGTVAQASSGETFEDEVVMEEQASWLSLHVLGHETMVCAVCLSI